MSTRISDPINYELTEDEELSQYEFGPGNEDEYLIEIVLEDSNLPEDLQQVMRCWPWLPPDVRRGIIVTAQKIGTEEKKIATAQRAAETFGLKVCQEYDRDAWEKVCAEAADAINEARQAVREGRMTVEEFDERF